MKKKYTDIEEMEFTYYTHFTMRVDDLDNADLFREGKVKQFWVKYGTLFILTTDEEVVSEYLPNAQDIFDNVDPKWPEDTMVFAKEEWMRVEEYNAKYKGEESD